MKHISIAIILIFNLFAAENNTTIPDVNTTVACEITNEIEFQPITNETGKQIMTSKKVYQTCVKNIIKQGACEKWEETKNEFVLPVVKGVETIDYQSEAGMASVIATMEAINRSNVIFSGTKGICEKGYTQDLSWTEDPLFWASVAGKAVSALGDDPTASDSEGEIKKASESVAATQDKIEVLTEEVGNASDAFNDITEELSEQESILLELETAQEGLTGSEWGKIENTLSVERTKLNSLNEQLLEAGENYENINNSLNSNMEILTAQEDMLQDFEGGLDIHYDEQTTLQQFNRISTQGYSGCMISGMIGLMRATYEYQINKNEECNPVDEICTSETTDYSNDDTGSIHTISVSEYETTLKNNSNLSSGYEIVKIEDGFVTIRILNAGTLVDPSDYSSNEEVEAAQEEAREKQFQLDAGFVALNMTLCMGSQASADLFDTPAPKSAGIELEEEDVVDIYQNTAMSALPAEYQIIAMFVMKLLETWEEVDSCDDEGDANRMGSRHVKAFRGLRFNTCHTVRDPYTVEEWPLTGDSMRKKSEFCCYESPISKILMVQFKSQLGSGWTNCTDVSWNQFSHIKWKKCSAEDKRSGPDGASFRGVDGVDYNMKSSYQYIKKCLNLDSLVEYIQSQTGIKYDNGSIQDFLEGFQQEDMDE